MAQSDYVYEQGTAVEVGEAGENDYEFVSGQSLGDGGDSNLVFVSGTGLGGVSAIGSATGTQLADVPRDHNIRPPSGEIDGTVYVTGGNTSGTSGYDISSDTWSTSFASASVTHDNADGDVIGGELYAFCGQTSTCERYDPGTDSWTSIASPGDLTSHTTETDGSTVWLVGRNGSASCYAYDVGTDSWSGIASEPTSTFVSASALVNGLVYKLGGDLNIGPTASTANESYDPGTDSWDTSPTDLPWAWEQNRGWSLNGIIYIANGRRDDDGSADSVDPINEVWGYDVGNDTWSDNEIGNTAKYSVNHGAAPKEGDVVYLIAGKKQDGRDSSLYNDGFVMQRVTITQ